MSTAPQQHLRIVAIVTLVYGILALIPALLMLLLTGGMFAGSAVSSTDAGGLAIAGGVMGLITIFLVIVALPGIAAGYGLLARHAWARPLTLILAIFHLFFFPIGTIVAIYQFWVLMFNQETVRAYQSESSSTGRMSAAR